MNNYCPRDSYYTLIVYLHQISFGANSEKLKKSRVTWSLNRSNSLATTTTHFIETSDTDGHVNNLISLSHGKMYVSDHNLSRNHCLEHILGLMRAVLEGQYRAYVHEHIAAYVWKDVTGCQHRPFQTAATVFTV